MPKTKKAAPTKTKRARKARRNPGGELATILFANPGGRMAKKARKHRRRRKRVAAHAPAAPKTRKRRRKHAAAHKVAHAVGHRVRRRARKNPDGGIADVLIDAAGATVGMVGARYVQNLTAMKMGTKDKAQASKPLHIALGALAPAAIGLALSHFAGKKKLGNALMTGGLVFGAHEMLRTFVFGKAQPGTPLYPLSGPDDEHLGSIALGDDGQEYAYVPDRGWLRISELPGRQAVRHQLNGISLRDQLGALELRDQLGGLAVRDQLGDDFNGLAVRDQLGSVEDLGTDEQMGAGDELGDEWGTY